MNKFQESLPKLQEILDFFTDWNQPYEISRLRMVEDSFLFIKSSEAESITTYIANHFDTSGFLIFRTKEKNSILPQELDKGNSMLRLKRRLNIETVLAAGDSEMDNGMLQKCDMQIPCDYLRYNGDYLNFIKGD